MTEKSQTKYWLGFLALALLVCVILAGALFGPDGVVISEQNSDLLFQGIHWREFGFGELRKGNLPLWNPHVFSGMPFLGSFESAMLYPLNLIYLVMPVTRAVTVSTAIHLMLAGVFMYLWALRQRLYPIACWLAAFLFMFSAPLFMHVYSGHISVVSSAAWIPLVFFCVDLLVERATLKRGLLAAFAVSMQILAGHPQTVYFTAMVAFVFALVLAVFASSGDAAQNRDESLTLAESSYKPSPGRLKTKRMLSVLLFLGCGYIGAALLSAAQLLSGIQAAAESVRAGGLTYEYASAFALAPENLVTFLVPGFFGDLRTFPYWGRFFIWEMLLFMSVSGFILMIYGVLKGERPARLPCMITAVVAIILALGIHTPVYRLLFLTMPGFDSFRGSSKFILQASPFLALVAAMGADSLLRGSKPPKIFGGAVIALAVVLGGAGIIIRHWASDPAGVWHHVLLSINRTGETVVPEYVCSNAKFVLRSGIFASTALFWSASVCLLVGLLYLKPFRLTPYLLCGIALLECFMFSRHYAVICDVRATGSPVMDEILKNTPGDYRILRLGGFEVPVSVRHQDMWGYDPLIPKRYAEFIAYTQGIDPDDASPEIPLVQYHPFYALLRCQFAFVLQDNKVNVMRATFVMPRLCLVPRWIVRTTRDEIFRAIGDPSFHPAQTVVLESAPTLGGVGPGLDGLGGKRDNSPGEVKLAKSTTDQLVIWADVRKPSVLLVTDPYSTGWRARALPGSSQKNYQVMPADYILRAIPLEPGRHRILLEYMPLGFRVGAWISTSSLIAFCVLAIVSYRRGEQRTQSG